jgi:hypothetical protein
MKSKADGSVMLPPVVEIRVEAAIALLTSFRRLNDQIIAAARGGAPRWTAMVKLMNRQVHLAERLWCAVEAAATPAAQPVRRR